MRVRYARTLCLCSLTLLFGCSTAHQTAKKHLQSGDYTASEQAYDNILRADPSDPAAREGIQKAREGIINKRLLSIRFARLAGNHNEALGSLSQLMDDQINWKVYPSGPVFFTQQEELKEALVHTSKIIEAHLKSGYPVPARLYFERHKNIFWQGKTLGAYEKLGAKIDVQGKKSCDVLILGATRTQVYYQKFLEKYCNYWSDTKTGVPTHENDQFLSQLYGSVSVNSKIADLPAEITGEFLAEFQDALQRTPYYSPKGKRNLTIAISGAFSDSRQKSPARLTQEYTTQEPYTAYVPVMKSRQIPYESSELVMRSRQEAYSCTKYEYDWQTGRSYNVHTTCYRTQYYNESVPTTAYRTEYYTENEPVTRYRVIPHAYNYSGIEYRQNLVLLINAGMLVDENEILLAVNEQETAQGIAHNENIPDIGLSPKQMNLIEPVEWIKTKSTKLGTSLSSKLQLLWEKSYCKPRKQARSAADSGEVVHKCVKANGGDGYEFVDQWFKTYTGLPYAEAKALFRD